jgi:diguanylate cyclase (GGDEF)-like protein/PAS domain S-box-containing protein
MESNIARILLNANITDQKNVENILISGQIINNFSGPALLTNSELTIIEHNIYAENLISSLKNNETILHSIIIRCLNNQCPDNQKVILECENGTRHYDLFAFPVNSIKTISDPRVLLFGKDVTVENNLTKALVDSRQMFKDLVSCSTDFAWETDGKGRFKYVSPSGILGYTAYELNDKLASNLIVGKGGINPFDTLDDINDVEIWLQRSDASIACVQVSASPIIDNNSTWQGARGVCRDVTHIKEREATLRRIRKREQILNKIISTIQNEPKPNKILGTTASAALDGIVAKHCFIYSISESGDNIPTVLLKAEKGEITGPTLPEAIGKLISSSYKGSISAPIVNIVEEKIRNHNVLIGFSRHHNMINGAICLLNDVKNNSWNKDEKSLMQGVANHLGIAFEQIKNYETLEKLSLTDELTSILNRRAFSTKVKKRLRNQKRQMHTCALLFIDLDNFKQVNDKLGHAKGDTLLQEMAIILGKNIRVGDYCARLGGDEFAVWLENISEDKAIQKAQEILKCSRSLRIKTPGLKPEVSVSIGIALSHPQSILNFDELMEHADKALYEVKKNGKSNVSGCNIKDI